MFRCKKLYFCFAVIMMIGLFIFLDNSYQIDAESTSSCRDLKVTSVQVEDGDSLWSIAKSYYNDSYEDISAFVQVIKKTNGLDNDKIYEGSYLVVPYYS